MTKKSKPAAAKPEDEGMDVQSGMEPGPDKDAKKAEVEAQFAEADRKGKAETAEEKAAREAEEQRVGQQVRGY